MKKSAIPNLPPDVQKADLEHPKYGSGDYLPNTELEKIGMGYESGFPGRFTFYKVEGRSVLGWVLTTLHISKPSSRARAGATMDRTYGIGVADSKVYTVGKGPHVTAIVEVYLTKANLTRLMKYVELWKKGMADAGGIRDRISSRRAQGQINRAEGMTYWDW